MTAALTAPALRSHGIDPADALDLLYAAVIGEHAELGRVVRALVPLHQVFPASATPWLACLDCPGDLGGHHCHCRCAVCACGVALCAGPCEAIDTMLDALVLRGLPAGAVDVPRTLSMLHMEGARRIVARLTHRAPAIVGPADDQPDATQITVPDEETATKVAAALRAEGYRCNQRDLPGPITAVRLIATPHR